MALADRDGRERRAVGHVADGVDRRHQRLRIAVDRDRAHRVDGDAHLFEPEIGGVGPPAGGDQHLVHMDHRAVGERRGDPVDASVEALHRAAERQRDAALGIGLAQRVAHVLVEAAKQLVAPVQERDLAAERVEDPGEFHRDIAGADHQDALRQASPDGRPRST